MKAGQWETAARIMLPLKGRLIRDNPICALTPTGTEMILTT